MVTSDMTIWDTEQAQQLAIVLSSLTKTSDIKQFLRDAMTDKEIVEISARLEAAKLLSQKVNYLEIAKRTKLSSRTIARISYWTKNGYSGYDKALIAINHQKAHILPASTD